MGYAELPYLQDVLAGISSRAQEYDLSGDWPEDDLRVLAAAGAMRWAVPMNHGGEDLSPQEIHLRYEAIASASLATSLILSQRDSAIGLLRHGENATLAEELLPKLAENQIFATVGIAQLTTSRQGGPPALLAEQTPSGYQLNGVIPWATGADRSQYVLAGAALVDGKQIIFALPTDLAGVNVQHPTRLVSLASSRTGAIRCNDVQLPNWLVATGPKGNALANRATTLPIGQAFLALGHCCGGIRLIGDHTSDRARAAQESFERELSDLRRRVLDYCAPLSEIDRSLGARLRGECNDLAVRITQSAVALYKGSALSLDHPAQRLVREAMFLMVWSCPDPVIDCTVDLLSKNNE
jgi:alkylation response protein AidB-like acyl-CoA dehydrogenase